MLGVRHRKLFTCPNVGHADRNASVNVLIRGCVIYMCPLSFGEASELSDVETEAE